MQHPDPTERPSGPTSPSLTPLDVAARSTRVTRHTFLRMGALAALPLAVAACTGRTRPAALTAPASNAATSETTGNQGASAAGATGQNGSVGGALASRTLTLTPANLDDDDLDLTPEQTEGPYFKRNSPDRTSLIDATTKGTRLNLTGRVLTTSGQPVARALLDFWQADAGGNYDNAGYLLRGHQFADDAGQYHLETVVPGLYPGRTRHIHVKVQAPNGPILTTQLYFPDEPRNTSDGIFDTRLVLPVQDAGSGAQAAAFDFVVQQ
jgi:protocatechuate 3,4-dioxygenase beta subunit